ncbi:hypothetical protein [Janibacter massiliensis]|uniref:hypothetical protein n=1 Tax=Janibacter massiliensis TaxID=2058291 RepID=UPI000D0FFDD4|nr:hypothetical protein [Janibacter massiliensis]
MTPTNIPTSLKIATVGGLAAAATAIGVAGAQADTSPSTAGATTSSTTTDQSSAGNGTAKAPDHGRPGPGRPGEGGPGGPREDAAALAKKLGITEAKLTAAMQKVHEANRPTSRPATPPTQADMKAHRTAEAAALAKQLGISESKVTAALDAVRDAHEAQERTDLATRLDSAVKKGTLTSGDKASVLKAFDAGVLRGGPAGGPHGR